MNMIFYKLKYNQLKSAKQQIILLDFKLIDCKKVVYIKNEKLNLA